MLEEFNLPQALLCFFKRIVAPEAPTCSLGENHVLAFDFPDHCFTPLTNR